MLSPVCGLLQRSVGRLTQRQDTVSKAQQGRPQSHYLSTCSHLHEWIAALANRIACRHLHFIDALVEPLLQLRLLLLHLECNDALSAPAMLMSSTV